MKGDNKRDRERDIQESVYEVECKLNWGSLSKKLSVSVPVKSGVRRPDPVGKSSGADYKGNGIHPPWVLEEAQLETQHNSVSKLTPDLSL